MLTCQVSSNGLVKEISVVHYPIKGKVLILIHNAKPLKSLGLSNPCHQMTLLTLKAEVCEACHLIYNTFYRSCVIMHH